MGYLVFGASGLEHITAGMLRHMKHTKLQKKFEVSYHCVSAQVPIRWIPPQPLPQHAFMGVASKDQLLQQN